MHMLCSSRVKALLVLVTALAAVGSGVSATAASDCVCSNPVRIAPTLGGQTLTAGCYAATGDAAWSLTGQLILSGLGSFVFMTPAALNTDGASVVSLTDGATCAAVKWCPLSAATLGASSVFVGSITTGVGASITLGAGVQLTGTLTPGNDVIITGAGATVAPCGLAATTTPPTPTLSSPLACTAGNTLAVSSDLGGLVLAPGCYTPTPADAAFALTGTLTLTGSGQYKFSAGGAFNTAANSEVRLTNGAACSGVFWSIGGAVTFGANSLIYGSVQTGATSPINIGANSFIFGALQAGNGIINSGAGVIAAPCKTAAPLLLSAALSPVASSAAAQVPIACSATCSNPAPLSFSDFGGHTVTPGCYTSSAAFALSGVLTLSGAGKYVFASAGALTTAASSIVSLTNGANCAQVSWCVSSATFGASSVFRGNVQTVAAITVGAGAAVTGVLHPANSVITYGAGATVAPCPVSGSGAVSAGANTCVSRTTSAVNANSCGCSNPRAVAPELGGQILSAGCYASANSSALTLTGTLVLNGPGAYVISTDAALTTAAGSSVQLLNGANCADITWCVSAAATFGANSAFSGRVTTGASGAITLGAGATVTGALTAGNGVITPGAASSNPSCPACAVAPVSSALLAAASASAAPASAPAPVCACVNPTVIVPTLDGQVITPGCYVSASAFTLTGKLTLNGAGSYVFSTPQYLTTAAASTVALVNGAACGQVQWCVGAAATLGGASIWSGSIVTGESGAITIGGVAQVRGKMSPGNGVLTIGAGASVVPCSASAAASASASTSVPGSKRVSSAAASASADCSCSPTSIAADLTGLNVSPGCYSPDAAAAIALTGSVTLSGAGRYVFKTVAALNTAANSAVVLSAGAVCSQVVWCVGSDVTLGASSQFQGTIQITGPAGAGAASGGAVTIGAATTVTGSVNALTVTIGDQATISPCAGAGAAGSGAVSGGGGGASCACPSPQILTSNDLGGQTLAPGCYQPTASGAFALTGTLTLNGAGAYVFSTPAALNTAANSVVALTNGAVCSAVNWCIGGAATLGAASTFNGQIVTLSVDAPITLGASVHMHGSTLAGNGIVNTGADTIVVPCGVADFSTLVATPPALESAATTATGTVASSILVAAIAAAAALALASGI